MWSSPIRASTPPWREVPAWLAWRNTSPVRSTPGALAVPDAEHAVVLALAPQLRLLRAPQRGGGQVLVEAGLEPDVVGLQDAPGAQQRGLQRGDGRAAVARDVARGVEAGLQVAGALGQHQADDGLGAGQELAGLVEGVLVVEADGVLGHWTPSACSPLPRRKRQTGKRKLGKRGRRVTMPEFLFSLPQTLPRLGLKPSPSKIAKATRDRFRNRFPHDQQPRSATILYAMRLAVDGYAP